MHRTGPLQIQRASQTAYLLTHTSTIDSREHEVNA